MIEYESPHLWQLPHLQQGHRQGQIPGSYRCQAQEDHDVYEPVKNEGKQDYTSMFCNKYCEDIKLPTVSNRLATIIVEYEIDKFKNDIPRNNKDNYGKNFMQSQYS